MASCETCVICGNIIPEGRHVCPSCDVVNHPSHYNVGKIEVIDAIEDWQLGFNLGNAVKYIARANYKGKRDEDLKKAIWYIKRELARKGVESS